MLQKKAASLNWARIIDNLYSRQKLDTYVISQKKNKDLNVKSEAVRENIGERIQNKRISQK